MIATRVGGEPASIAIPGSDLALPVFTFPEPAAAALALAVRYARIRSAPRHRSSGRRASTARKPTRLSTAHLVTGGSWLDAAQVVDLLSCYGIPTCPQRVVQSADAAAAAAAALGYPVVAKIAAPGGTRPI